MDFSLSEWELPIVIVQEHEVSSNVLGYHEYTYFFNKKPVYKKLEAGAPCKLRNFQCWIFWSPKN